MEKRIENTINEIKKYFKLNNFENAVIGISGGVDSAVVASLLVKALGKDHITPEIIYKIRKQVDSKKYNKILLETKSAKIWIYEAIKQICREN